MLGMDVGRSDGELEPNRGLWLAMLQDHLRHQVRRSSAGNVPAQVSNLGPPSTARGRAWPVFHSRPYEGLAGLPHMPITLLPRLG